VDGDGDLDVLSASPIDNKIAWYENDGSEVFTVHEISTVADGAQSVFAADVDGDGDMDVLSASQNDDKIAWYENRSSPVLAVAGNITYIENDPATAINTGITVADIDSATLASATITITNAIGQDLLSFTNDGSTMGNIAISTSTTFALTLTSAGATAALRTVRYANTSDNPTTTQRSVTFVVNDGTLNSNTATTTISITATPEAPVNLSVSTSAGSEQSGTVVTVTATTTLPVVGNQTVDLEVKGLNITGADFTLSNTTITIPNGQTSGSVTFTILNDGLAEGEELAALTISNPSSKLQLGTTTSRNVSIADSFKATVLGFDTAVNFTEGDQATLLDADITVADSDSPNFGGGSLTVYLNDALELSDRLAISHQGNVHRRQWLDAAGRHVQYQLHGSRRVLPAEKHHVPQRGGSSLHGTSYRAGRSDRR
jgi:FG-GAP-like repeat